MRLLLAILLTSVSLSVFAGELVLQGVYAGKDLYIRNPYDPSTNSFCTQKVYVNDRLVFENPRASAFKIDLSDLYVGDLVVIRIEYQDGCSPTVINPQVLQKEVVEGFRFLSAQASNNSIEWEVEGAEEGASFIVEQENFTRDSSRFWQVWKTVESKGNPGTDKYAIPSNNYPGENKYRIKYQAVKGEDVYSVNILFTNTDQPITFYPVSVTTRINLSEVTYFEITDRNGKLLRSGTSDVIQLQDLRPGEYFLHIQNRVERFVKK